MERDAFGTNFVRYTMGELTIVALRDGHVDMPPSRLRRPGDKPFGADLPAQVTLIDGRLRLSVNAFLVVEGDRHILIDTGAGNAWDPTMGLLLGALAEAGVAREDITTVALTHTHLDHVGGLVAADGSDAFPRLERLFVPDQEIALFVLKKRVSKFAPLCVPMTNGTFLSDSITALEAFGHEVGHTAFEVASGSERMLIWGDIVHVPSIQFAKPDLSWELDADQVQARATRARVLALAARPGLAVAGAHLDFPGVGRVAEAGDAYVFSPT